MARAGALAQLPGALHQTEANEILGLIMALYHDIISRLANSETYGPLLDEDIDGTFLWEFWAEGFGKAMSLRPWAWATFKDRPEGDLAVGAFSTLAALVTIARETEYNPDIYDEIDEQFINESPLIIATCVSVLHNDRTSDHQHPARSEKGGRDDPCPCGSEKKYKKCCLQARNA